MNGRRATWEGGTKRDSRAGRQGLSAVRYRRPLMCRDAERGRGTIWAPAGHRVGMPRQGEV